MNVRVRLNDGFMKFYGMASESAMNKHGNLIRTEAQKVKQL